MINGEEHESRMKRADNLLEKHQIRQGLKGKLYYTYPRIFEGIYELLCLSESDDLFFNLLMHYSSRMISDYEGNKNEIKIDWWLEPNVNYSLLVQEIFDDFWASFLCFQHGFTKQATEILRNTVELIVNLYFMKFIKKEDDQTILNWLKGERGIVNIDSKIEDLRKIKYLKEENISPYLKQLYGILCAAAHSHKKHMTSITIPGGIWVKDKMMFEPFIIPQTRGIFLWVVETELKMIKHFVKQDKETPFLQKIFDTITKMEGRLNKYSTTIESIKKGYVLHRKQVRLDSGKTILFSLKINNQWEFPGKQIRSLNQHEKKELKDKIENLLISDTS